MIYVSISIIFIMIGLFIISLDSVNFIIKVLWAICICMHAATLSRHLNINDSYISPYTISQQVKECQKDLPPYQKCLIKVEKPNTIVNSNK